MSSQTLGTGRFLWRMAAFRPWIYVGDNLLWTAVYCSRLLPGLVAQQAFDALQRGAIDPPTIAWLAAAFVGSGIAGAVANTAGSTWDTFFRFSVSAVLQRNMLAEILRRPGARALDRSPGEALSVFRDDVQHAEDGSDWTVDMISLTIFAAAAMWILVSVNATITIFVFLPLLAIVAVAQVVTRRLQQSRAARQVATSRVTGALGEIFGAVQAVQIARAERGVVDHFSRLSEQRRQAVLREQKISLLTGSIYWNTGSTDAGIFESSQGRFKGSPLQNMEAYVRNSPVYFADRVQTPLIILQNDKDGAVDFNQGVTYYNTLLNQKKEVMLLEYVGENHGLAKPANQKDYAVRMKEFFDYHLNGAPEADWIKNGVPRLKMEEHLQERKAASDSAGRKVIVP